MYAHDTSTPLPNVPEEETAAEKSTRDFFARHVGGRGRGKLRRLRKLFPRAGKETLRSPPKTVLSLVCDLGCLSFRAYNDPTVPGYDEVTVTGNRVKHLNYDVLNNAVEGVLKIFLQSARNVIDADLFAGKSDPYVVFSTGWSQVASATIDNEDNPVWNSTHYLLIRKPGVIARDDTKLNITLYDSDIAWGENEERNFRQFLVRDDFLGSATVDLAELKKPGVHKKEIELELKGDERKNKTVVVFTAQFLPFREACAELGKSKDSGSWSQRVEESKTFKWTELPVDVHVGHIIFQPIAFINCMKTGTQAWIHVNQSEKALAVAFRGTEANRLKDLITDLSVWPRRLDWDNDGSCSLRFTEHVQESKIRIHSGFRSAYQSVWSTILTIVANVTDWSNEWTICLTGHSLGGALATLCAFEYANRMNYEGNSPRIVMMNFGAPRLGNKHFKRAFRITVPDSYRVVNKLDIIHKIPMFLKHVPREVSFEEDGEIIVDKRHSMRLDIDETIIKEEELSNTPPAKKLTRRKMLSAPGIKGHFEDYYFDVVTKAVVSFFKDHRDQMHHLICDLKQPCQGGGESSEGSNRTSAEIGNNHERDSRANGVEESLDGTVTHE